MFKIEIKKDGVLTNYSEFKTVPDCEFWMNENYDYFPSGFTYEIINVTEKKIFEASFMKGLRNQQIGREVLAIIYAINDEKTKLGLLNQQQLSAMLQDPTLSIIERLLLNGSLGSAISLIKNSSDTFFNSEHKTMILDYIEKNK